MGKVTGISWTNHTFNPWWGCWKIAPECKNCYADTTAHRYVSQFGELWGRTSPRRFFPAKHWLELSRWNAAAEREGVRARVFVGSMCDWAERHPDPAVRVQQDAAREQLWREIRSCQSLDFLLLTKRPEDAAELVPWADPEVGYYQNVWLGVSAGAVESLDKIETLKRIPCAVRFVSCEPILEAITAEQWDRALTASYVGTEFAHEVVGEGIDWLIVGDESGHHARPADPEWVRTARDAAARHGVAFHFKQWAGEDAEGISGRIESERKGGARKIHLPMLDGERHAAFPK